MRGTHYTSQEIGDLGHPSSYPGRSHADFCAGAGAHRRSLGCARDDKGAGAGTTLRLLSQVAIEQRRKLRRLRHRLRRRWRRHGQGTLRRRRQSRYVGSGKGIPPWELLSHKWPYELPFRGFRGEKQAPFYQGDIAKSIAYADSDNITIDRVRVLGGRTMHWNAVTLRYAPRDFKEWSLQGIEEDWPLTYEELAPYYDRIEQIIGVCGNDDHLEILPAGKNYLPPIPWRCSEHIMNRATSAMGIPLIAVRKAVLTRPYDKRPPCHYCGHCMDGCDVASIFSTPDCMLPKARATGNFTLRQNALAREVLVDREGLASAVSFIDTETRAEQQVKAKIVVVCCSTVESARLLLNSRSPQTSRGTCQFQRQGRASSARSPE